ncbi:hypothetical protein H8E06_01100 [bacterium]|nr:hypothetical protein [bacterium]
MKLEDNISAPLEDAITPIGKDVINNHKLDRISGETLKLPYMFDDIKLNPNSHITHKIFNESVQRLHDNMVYIDAHTKIMPNNFPEIQKKWFGQTNPGTAKLEYLDSPFKSSPLHVPDAAVTTIINNITAAAFFTRDKKQYGVFGNGNRLVIIQYSKDKTHSSKTLHDSDGIDSGPRGDSIDSNYFSFSNISKVIVHENILYVCDSGLKKIFKYDITGFFTNNPATKKRGKVLLKQIGGTGTNADKVKFNTCVTIERSSSGKIYVLDYSLGNNATIKILDGDLNWEKTYKKEATFKVNPPVDFCIDQKTNILYILSSNGTIVEVSADFRTDKLHTDIHNLQTGEIYSNIFLSSISGDVLYVATSKTVLKKFKTHLSKNIGRFKTTNEAEIVGSEEVIRYACSGNVRDSKVSEEVYVAVKQTKSGAEVYSIPRKPIAWGLNHKGQINIPLEITNDELEPYSMHAGFNTSIARVPPGKLIGWGDNTYNQVTDIPIPLRHTTTSTTHLVEDVGIGLKHCVAVTNTGIITAWGDNRYGQINVPKSLTDGTVTVVACDAGEYHSAAVDDTGKVYLWGLNDNGQVDGSRTTNSTSQYGPYYKSTTTGDGTLSALEFTSPDSNPVVAADIVCGYNHNFIIDTAHDNRVIGWGSNYFKQTDWDTASGSGSVVNPKYINVPGTTEPLTATQIRGGYGHTIALTGNWPDTGIVSWGLNNYGQVIGTPHNSGSTNTDEITSTSRLFISGHAVSGVSAIEAGAFHNAAVYTTQTWGAAISAAQDNYNTDVENQLVTWGSGTFNQSTIPYSLYKSGIDLSLVYDINLYGDTSGTGSEPSADSAAQSQVGDQIRSFFSTVSSVDVRKIAAGFGHTLTVARALPAYNNPTYIYEFGVANLYKTIIYDRYRESCYSASQLKINKNEFISSWVVNKCFTKLIYNHVLLYNNFHSNFTFVRDASGNAVFKDTRFITKSPKTFNNLSFDSPNDFFTGTNEPIVTETFNRGLKKIYDMQLGLLKMSKDHYIDVYPPVSKTLDITKSEYI